MSHYLQVLQSPLTRDRIALIPQDKKAIALSILKLRKNPSDSHSRSIIREQMMATTDFKERRELERILSFAECPVYSDTQKGHLEMAQNIGFHWANKIIAKYTDSVIDDLVKNAERSYDVDDESSHEEIKNEIRKSLKKHHSRDFNGEGDPELAKMGKVISQKINGLDKELPLPDMFTKSTLNRFSDYIEENFELFKKEIKLKQREEGKRAIQLATSRLKQIAKDDAIASLKDIINFTKDSNNNVIKTLIEDGGLDREKFNEWTNDDILETFKTFILERIHDDATSKGKSHPLHDVSMDLLNNERYIPGKKYADDFELDTYLGAAEKAIEEAMTPEFYRKARESFYRGFQSYSFSPEDDIPKKAASTVGLTTKSDLPKKEGYRDNIMEELSVEELNALYSPDDDIEYKMEDVDEVDLLGDPYDLFGDF